MGNASKTGVPGWILVTPAVSILIPLAAVIRMQGGLQAVHPYMGWVAGLMAGTVFGIVAGRCTR
jgi:hypothetical protein